jgi:hypothetical protein
MPVDRSNMILEMVLSEGAQVSENPDQTLQCVSISAAGLFLCQKRRTRYPDNVEERRK